jgi:hypothetical protein
VSNGSTLPGGADAPSAYEPWCKTLRGEQAWKIDVRGGEPALEMWRALRDRHPRTGLWPIVLGGDPQVADQLTWRLDMLARDAPGIPSIDSVTPAPELFVEWMGDPAEDDYLNDVPRHLAKLSADAESIAQRMAGRSDADAVQALAFPTVNIGLVPARAGYEVPALLGWAGAERDNIGGAEHLSVLQFWFEHYGAELVSLGLERMELLVEHPPDDARGAFELAVQHYSYCPALMDNLVPAMGALAAMLFGRHWIFDWS